MLALALVGCHVSTPEPLPDAARESGVTLVASPALLVIHPSASGRITFRAKDEAQRPLAHYPMDFTIVPDGTGDVQDIAGARLSTRQSLTNLAGETTVEVIVGPLANRDRPVAFSVRALAPGAASAETYILVTTNAYSVEVFPTPAEALIASGQVAATNLYFYDNATCAELDLYDLASSATRSRTPQLVPAYASFVFPGVAASGAHAVVGLGLDNAQTKLIGGCVDIAGEALLESETMRTTLVLDHLFPALAGSYTVGSDISLTPPPSGVTALAAAWQEWQRCPFDPARLWLDCTVAALGPEPRSCRPSPESAGPLAALVSASRGTVVPGLDGTLADTGATPCRGGLDASGKPSLEPAIDALFASARAEPPLAALGDFPRELAALLEYVHLETRLTLLPAAGANSYWAEHEILAVAFPTTSPPVALGAQVLALPAPVASGILTTLRNGQLFAPNHALTLRLGTAARHAFESTSLGRRGAYSTDAFIEAVFSRARLAEQRTALAGCAAFDAVVCDRVTQPRQCVESACHAGLALLGRALRAAFLGLDGDGSDFQLSGSAPVIDTDGDGHADALGLAGGPVGMAAGPGLWSIVLETRSGTHATYGAWLGTR